MSFRVEPDAGMPPVPVCANSDQSCVFPPAQSWFRNRGLSPVCSAAVPSCAQAFEMARRQKDDRQQYALLARSSGLHKSPEDHQQTW